MVLMILLFLAAVAMGDPGDSDDDKTNLNYAMMAFECTDDSCFESYFVLRTTRKRKRRSRAGNFHRERLNWTKHLETFTRNAFREKYRMTQRSFEKLFQMINPYLPKKQQTNSNIPIDNRIMLSMCIRYLAGGSVHDIMSEHRVSKVTFYKSVKETLRAIDQCKGLRFRFSSRDFRSLAEGFQGISKPRIWDALALLMVF
jgi:hypothetical protein